MQLDKPHQRLWYGSLNHCCFLFNRLCFLFFKYFDLVYWKTWLDRYPDCSVPVDDPCSKRSIINPMGFVFPSCSALIRPGRFDMQVTVPRPDVKGRTEILKWYLKKIKVDPGILSHTWRMRCYWFTFSWIFIYCTVLMSQSVAALF